MYAARFARVGYNFGKVRSLNRQAAQQIDRFCNFAGCVVINYSKIDRIIINKRYVTLLIFIENAVGIL